MYGKSVKDVLLKDDIKGDIVFSIVVKEINCSRIFSILVFFEINVEIIKIVNEDGYLFLYFCVRFLKEELVYMEFECCIRVIIFILYGVDLDKLLDKDEKLIDECKNDFVKDILCNFYDEKKMENLLKSI